MFKNHDENRHVMRKPHTSVCVLLLKKNKSHTEVWGYRFRRAFQKSGKSCLQIFLGFAFSTIIIGLTSFLYSEIDLPSEKHPFVYFTQDDLPIIEARIKREPYKSWYESLIKRANSYLNAKDPGNDHTERAERAKELAFIYQVTKDIKYANLAIKHLLKFEDNPPFKQGTNYPIRYARILFDACAAYDMSFDYLQDYPNVNAQIRRKLAKGAQASHDFTPVWYARAKNNWGIRQYSSLGLDSRGRTARDTGCGRSTRRLPGAGLILLRAASRLRSSTLTRVASFCR